MKKYSLILSLVLVVALAVLSAASPAVFAAERTVVYAQEVPVVELEPLAGYINAPSPYEVGLVLYDNLVRFDRNLKIVPDLATSWRVSDDDKTWTFKLRQGVVFHDGTPFDAEAVKFNIERSMDKTLNPLNRPLWDPLADVKVIDKYTVAIETKYPFPTLLNTLAHGSAAIVSPTAVKKYGDKFATNPVGTGPYRLESFEPGVQVTVRRWDRYFGPKPDVERIVFRYVPDSSSRVAMLQSGQADIIAAVTPQDAVTIGANPQLKVISRPTLRTVGIGMNLLSPELQDARVRTAFNYLVDKNALVKAVFLGHATVLDSPVAPNASGYKKIGAYEFDREKALRLLAEAGWHKNKAGVLEKDGRTMRLTMITAEGAYPNDLQVVQVVANQLKAAGVDVSINKIDKASYWDALKVPAKDAKFDLFIWAFNPSNGDGGYTLSSLFKSNPDDNGVPQVWNIGRYRNAEFDSLLAAADKTMNDGKRDELLGRAQKILMEDNPYIWLYAENRSIALRKGIENVELLPTLFADLSAVAKD